MRPLLVSLTVSICVLCTSTTHAQRWQDLYVPIPSSEIPCRVMKPIEIVETKKYPVILSLHGAGGRGSDSKKQLKVWNSQLAEPTIRKKFPCYVVTPQADSLWDKSDYLHIKAIINELPAVDKNRIYILGHSMGGHGTYIFLQFETDYFAAAGPSAGTGLRSTKPFISAQTISHYPIWAFHGDQDGTCPFSNAETLFKELSQMESNMKFTIWKGDKHGVANKFIPGGQNGITHLSGEVCDPEPDFLTWLFKQSRGPQKVRERAKQ